jgi:2-dehydro-3-deoxyphosphogluconate aldolase / (4S)-4-hydroxy-2-oxoglutarate aldolase
VIEQRQSIQREVTAMTAPTEEFIARLRRVAVVPVVTIDEVAAAVPLARALLAGGIDVIEVTLRTPAAIEAIRRIAAEVPEVMAGAGTVLSEAQMRESLDAGAKFIVSPGLTPVLAEAGLAAPMPLLAGIATASEAMIAAERGLSFLKFFPAESIGGAKALKALAAPLPHIRFCPTGGIDAAKAGSYLALSNVVCIGGSWIASPAAIRAADWATITRFASEASRGLAYR